MDEVERVMHQHAAKHDEEEQDINFPHDRTGILCHTGTGSGMNLPLGNEVGYSGMADATGFLQVFRVDGSEIALRRETTQFLRLRLTE